jgi:hypothetical protein
VKKQLTVVQTLTPTEARNVTRTLLSGQVRSFRFPSEFSPEQIEREICVLQYTIQNTSPEILVVKVADDHIQLVHGVVVLSVQQVLNGMRQLHEGESLIFRLKHPLYEYGEIMRNLPLNCHLHTLKHGVFEAFFDAREKPREIKE